MRGNASGVGKIAKSRFWARYSASFAGRLLTASVPLAMNALVTKLGTRTYTPSGSRRDLSVRSGSVSTCARWRIPVVVGYAPARFRGDESGCGARHVDQRPSGIGLSARRKAIGARPLSLCVLFQSIRVLCYFRAIERQLFDADDAPLVRYDQWGKRNGT